MAFLDTIKRLANDVRTKVKASEVRDSFAKSMEETGKVADESDKLSKDTQFKQGVLDRKYDDQIANMTLDDPSSAEMVDGRHDGVTGESFPTIGKRMDHSTAQLAQTEKEAKWRTPWVSVNQFMEYRVLLADKWDWGPAINAAIKYAAQNQIPRVMLEDVIYTTGQQIIGEPSVQLQGTAVVGFYNGMRWFEETNNPTGGTRIQAIADIQSVIFYDGRERNRDGFRLLDVIIDGNKKAQFCVQINGDGSAMRENNVYVTNCGIQGAKLDGIMMQATLTNRIVGCNICANGRWGINGDYGFSDSLLSENYIHGNQSGGLRMAGGSGDNQIIAGKIEDNYGPGIFADGTAGETRGHQVTGVIFNANNGPAITSRGQADITATAGKYSGNARTQTGAFNATFRAELGAYIYLNGVISSGAGYHMSSDNLSKVVTTGSRFSGARLGVTYQINNVIMQGNNLIDGKLQIFNPGARSRRISLNANQNGYVTFDDMVSLDGYGPFYFGAAIYQLHIQTSRHPQTSGFHRGGMYLVHVSRAGNTYSASLQPVLPFNDTDWVRNIEVSLGNNAKNLVVHVLTGNGVDPGNAGHKELYLHLVDTGANGLGIL